MQSAQIRQTFLDFFASKGHQIVPSAPMVIKNDPTLMFTNAGMNQFKDIFLGNAPAKWSRVADTQKCLRVSGKHNDLEEVGVDTYHHTMFEMLGNWSFGDYFKKDAIAWAWELLTEVYKIDKSRIYVTVFEGDAKENLAFDQEAFDTWKQFIAEDRILNGNKKDNFWEMGDTGPCGPCTEIHVDLRDDDERAQTEGKTLVNNDHPQVIEIWNNVFMEFNRKADGSLEKLPSQHVDTGMGFERLCMVLQGKKSNYDTDVFQPYIQFIERESGIKYKQNEDVDIAMRVLSDHVRTIVFAIADGQLPSNNKAGYVIRRILRRAVRYYYTFLGFDEPFIHKLIPIMIKQMGDFFPEIVAQQSIIQKVVFEEEASFLKTISKGLGIIHEFVSANDEPEVDENGNILEIQPEHPLNETLPGEDAFFLYDTLGFPIDLTALILKENGWKVDMDGFNQLLTEQKNRSRAATSVETGDWVILSNDAEQEFIGYEHLSVQVKITRYRQVNAKGKNLYQLVFNITPFYAEGGGQVGDTGTISNNDETICILDTKKENGITIHITEQLPKNLVLALEAQVDSEKRYSTQNNHSATHLLHAALRQVLGTHVEQKGSLVNAEHLRFDFSHFAKVNEEELQHIERLVNEKIRQNIQQNSQTMPIEAAKKAGAMALFGEKYSDLVRVVTFDPTYSIELCGGTHVNATGQIGFFKIVSEGAVAAGVRRIEAITGKAVETYVSETVQTLEEIKQTLKTKDVLKSIRQLQEEQQNLQKQIEQLLAEKAQSIKKELITKVETQGDVKLIRAVIALDSSEAGKNIAFELKNQFNDLVLVIGQVINNKPLLTVAISDELVKSKNLHAGQMVKTLAQHIKGGGGGQAFYATAGGNDASGLTKAMEEAMKILG
jgi:alanyl-tRNA synthetase